MRICEVNSTKYLLFVWKSSTFEVYYAVRWKGRRKKKMATIGDISVAVPLWLRDDCCSFSTEDIKMIALQVTESFTWKMISRCWSRSQAMDFVAKWHTKLMSIEISSALHGSRFHTKQLQMHQLTRLMYPVLALSIHDNWQTDCTKKEMGSLDKEN